MNYYPKVEAYIISVIDASGYDDVKQPVTDVEKMKFVYDTFQAEYGWRTKQVSLLQAVADWISGLPSSCNIEFKNHLIIEYAKAWGLLHDKSSERAVDDFLNRWFKFMAQRLLGLWHRHGIC